MKTPARTTNDAPDTGQNLAENKAVVRRWFAALERGDMDEVEALWATAALNHASGRPGLRLPVGGTGIGMVTRVLRTAFPDRRWQIDDIIAEADVVACRMSVSGTFGAVPPRPPFAQPPDSVGVEGTILIGSSATGKQYSVKHMHMFRIADGRIAEHWAARDDLSLLLQLGAIALPQPTDSEV